MPQTRRRVARIAAAVLTVVAVGLGATGCGATSGKQTIKFAFSKREAIDHMNQVVADYNKSQNKVEVVMDTSGVDVTSASFVRGNPPDIALANHNMEVSRFVERCTLTDLSKTKAAQRINPDLTPLVDQYGVCEGRTSALPYSVMAASVIYNKGIFAQHNIEVPKTWSELIKAADKLKAAGVDPFYATFMDPWTIGQGWFDYTIGGSIDVKDFFDKLKAEKDQVGPNSAVSFQKDFLEPMTKMRQLTDKYVNGDAGSRLYGDGNLAFSQGKAAMYLQGPWAFSEIAKSAPADLELGTFPLPMTEDPADLKIRVNMDLAIWIPEKGKNHEAALDFLEYLYTPEVIDAYNASQLGFAPTTDARQNDDPRVAGMKTYYEEGKIYQGPSVLVHKSIPVFNYGQAMVFGADPKTTLATLDADWARLAFRQK
ncbi:MAG: extracellular solute-binding protein [Propioniciclava sp.]|uniref:ABC transporter substrate-binding protein n=1 Tax=Propioniciclava sp. TaxID=2038686 RepID=UPI0039E35640